MEPHNTTTVPQYRRQCNSKTSLDQKEHSGERSNQCMQCNSEQPWVNLTPLTPRCIHVSIELWIDQTQNSCLVKWQEFHSQLGTAASANPEFVILVNHCYLAHYLDHSNFTRTYSLSLHHCKHTTTWITFHLIRFAISISIMSASNPNNRNERFPGLLLLVRAAEAETREDTMQTPPRIPSTVTITTSNAPPRPKKRYMPGNNPKSAFSPLRPMKRFKDASPSKVSSSSQSPTIRPSPRRAVRRVSQGCQQPRDHVIWENVDGCRQARNASSPFRMRPRVAWAPQVVAAAKADVESSEKKEATHMSIHDKILDDLKRRMEFWRGLVIAWGYCRFLVHDASVVDSTCVAKGIAVVCRLLCVLILK